MEIQKQKSEVFAQVAALKVLVDDTHNQDIKYKSQTNQLWQSLQTIKKDPINFLLDLIKELAGYEAIRDSVSDALINSLGDLEDKIKFAIKLNLKELTSCGVNPSIPNELKYNGSGYQFNVNKIDYCNIFKLDPASEYGNFIYSDITPQINSTDANTFLFYTIQNSGVEQYWGHQVGFVNDIVAVKFDEQYGTETNIITIKASNYYSNNKKLSDWNNDYVDSIKLFPDAQFFAKMIDNIFNIFSNIIEKTTVQSEMEEKLNNIIDKLLETEPDDIIDDSFFTFTNVELLDISEKAKMKTLGISKLETCDTYATKINTTILNDSVNTIITANSIESKTIAINKSINNIADEASKNSDPKDRYNVKLNFFVKLIKALVKSIIGMIFSPKLILLFMVNFRIVQGTNATFNGIDELIKNLKVLIKEVIDIVKALVIKILLEKVLKEIKNLQSQVKDKIQSELISNKKKLTMSLLGVPQDIIRTINKF